MSIAGPTSKVTAVECSLTQLLSGSLQTVTAHARRTDAIQSPASPAANGPQLCKQYAAHNNSPTLHTHQLRLALVVWRSCVHGGSIPASRMIQYRVCERRPMDTCPVGTTVQRRSTSLKGAFPPHHCSEHAMLPPPVSFSLRTTATSGYTAA